MTPEICPNCGADVPPKASACPECGSCEETGWSEEAAHADLGLPDEDFSYSEFTKREFGDDSPVPAGLSRFWWIVGIALLAVILGICLFVLF